jgi:integrase
LLDQGKEVLQEMVIKYAKSLRDNPRIVKDKKTGQERQEKYSYATVHNRIASVLYFFENNDIELNKRKIRRYYPPDESTNDDKLYTMEQIRRILSVCDLRTKAMIMILISSGVRIGALHTMRIGDLIPVTYQGQDLYKIRVYARTRDEYYSFVTPEARITAIDPYLDYRNRCREKLDDESPLFRKQFNRSLINNPYPLCQGAVMKAVDDAIKKSGVKSKKIMRSHSFRKGFKSNCEQSGMKSRNVELLMGHDIGVSGHYYRPAESDILKDFMLNGAVALTIDDTQRLKKENADLRKTQHDYLAELGDRHDFNEMKQLLVHLSKESQKQLVDEFNQKVGDKADIEWSCDD